MTIWQPNIQSTSGPRYLAIANALEDDVKHGRLNPGTKLPTHRELADTLGVTVGTVTRGYAEAARRGLLRGETGRGTYVGGEPHHQFVCHKEHHRPEVVDMKLTLPFEALNPDIGSVLREMALSPDAHHLLEYSPSAGRQADRAAGAHWLTRYNLKADTETITLTAGGQNALAVILSALFRPGDAIAVESITYPLLKTLARRFHLKLVPVEQDSSGMIPDSLEEVCRTYGVRGVYVMPSCQNPTTVRMPDFRRQEIAALTRRHDLFIMEDDAYGLVAGDFGVPFASRAPERTFFVASLSKPVAGGLRVAYLVSPSQHVCAVKRAISDMLWMTPPLMAAIARRWIEDGTADRTLEAKRNEAARRTILTATMLPEQDIAIQQNGFYGWLKLPEPWTAGDFARVAEENDVMVSPDDIFVVGRRPLPHAVRLGLSGAPTLDDLKRGLETIRTILQSK
ncbi:aminotransferase-like domain-containing protein [Pseudodesulfovibrio piezophilus]|uniref:Transcriptional regulator, GntR family with aminotransferase domain n=1 Tax=Pseudodesulfovibrio piezophilus (strain DSM 21447 / JCM 15486 / C1TLV30) TaxID=1322246 RepID=M1WM83_PSEP2|nr:PLP-dependent aminotransferase family protein [Pseudodesulfovibrio piezophilus]CCH49155.1 Transcriptional regulator, GntR family with aminotransferase domain [Pseudodesulfovibrio piezophilus C1TLV30]